MACCKRMRAQFSRIVMAFSAKLRRGMWVLLALSAVAGIILPIAHFSAPRAPQGMASPGRAARGAPRIQTTLPPIEVNFEDMAAQAGLTASHVSGGDKNKKYIIETTGSGVAIFDFDNDGRMDIFLVNGTRLEGFPKGEEPTSHLYRNLGDLRFEEVTEKAGLRRSGWGHGACAGDYDNDGFRDLLVTYFGHSALYHNNGNGTFTDVTASAGLESPRVRWDTGCSFVDYDLDGKLDLAIVGYVEFDISKVPAPGTTGNCQWKGIAVMCGPRGLPAGRNLLYHNEGGGRFRDVSASSGFGRPQGRYGFTVIASDFDNDGYPDLYVACDSTPSLLYRNKRDGTFEEMGVRSGAALNEDGQEQAGMGVDVADYDEDGHFDMVKTNFSDDTPNLYHNNGDGTFTDSVYLSGLSAHTQFLGWGVHFIDVDHDGRKEVLMINGHVYPEVEQAGPQVRYRQPRLLYWNVGKGQFVDISERSGSGIRQAWCSRGSAVADLDNDGSLEVVINNMGERPSLLKNSGKRKNWLELQLVGVRSNRDAVGARAYVYAGERRLSGEVRTGSGYLSQSDPRLHFGLGDDAGYQRIEVQWPGGGREVFPAGNGNRLVLLKQGAGKRVGAPRGS